MRVKRLLLASAIGLVTVAAIAFVATWRAEIAPTRPPSRASLDPKLIAKGAELALIGNCMTCHTAPGGPAYAGGRRMATPFGTIHSTNITPEPDTGIGAWSEAAFRRAMHEGVRRDGAHLYPAFPYDHFTKLTDEDVGALYAFLITRTPVRQTAPDNDLAYPMNLRPLIAGWKLLFFERTRFKPDRSLSAEVNRGAYLVDAVAHCGACHTPRNALGAERDGRLFDGSEVENWHAPALNAASPAPVPWTPEQLATYLRRGYVAQHGVAAGPMQDVVDNLAQVDESEVRAIAAYVGSILAPATAARRPAATAAAGNGANASADGAVLYRSLCADCHEPRGQGFPARGIRMADSKVVAMHDPRNLAHLILDGTTAPDATPSAWMPGFADMLTDRQVTALMTYLRTEIARQPAWPDLERQLRRLRANDS